MQEEQSYGKCNKRNKEKEINRFAELVNALVLKTNPFGVGSSSLPNGKNMVAESGRRHQLC